MRKYENTTDGRVYEVWQDWIDDAWICVYRGPQGGVNRTKRIEPCATEEEAQAALDAKAKREKWVEV